MGVHAFISPEILAGTPCTFLFVREPRGMFSLKMAQLGDLSSLPRKARLRDVEVGNHELARSLLRTQISSAPVP